MPSEIKVEDILEEVREILESYDVFEHDVERILEEIEKPYDLLEQALNDKGSQTVKRNM